MTTRAECRTIVRSFIDEPTPVRWPDSILNTFINLAIQQVQNLLISSGSNVFHQTATVNAIAGIVDLSAVAPLKILSLAQTLSPVLLTILPIRPKDAIVRNAYTGALELVYVPKAELPAGDGYTLTYGAANASNSVLDQLTAVLAARLALITDNEPRAGLEALRLELEGNVRAIASVPSSFVMPTNDFHAINRSIMSYHMSGPNTIQLSTRV
ncbi:MAG TPA: hypothetical protein VJ327_11325 [Patescibacteria group bacterium]|nr:hypothetical protein [Patescibacteria group bacterium]